MMLCPICKTIALVMSERQSIEIDYCPACRGVWLDRGELDKIIERTIQAEGNGAATLARAPAIPMSGERLRHGEPEHHNNYRHDGSTHGQQGRRGSIWKELFD
jgi:Zn-finger nucleic acid-binding protein